MTTITKYHWFWAWNDDKEEAWLRQMAQQGWHLSQFGFPGFYTFEQGSPRDVAYRLDFFTSGKDKADYLQLFKDAGWDHVGQYGSWQYFRKEAVNGEAPEIFTDNESKIQKYQRVIALLVFATSMLVLVISNPATRLGIVGSASFFSLLIYLLLAVFELLCAYGILKLIQRISQLKRR